MSYLMRITLASRARLCSKGRVAVELCNNGARCGSLVQVDQTDSKPVDDDAAFSPGCRGSPSPPFQDKIWRINECPLVAISVRIGYLP